MWVLRNIGPRSRQWHSMPRSSAGSTSRCRAKHPLQPPTYLSASRLTWCAASIIGRLMYTVKLSLSAIERAYPVTFARWHGAELVQLQAFEADGLLTLDRDWRNVTPKGRLLIRTTCMGFDRYLGSTAVTPRFSPLT